MSRCRTFLFALSVAGAAAALPAYAGAPDWDRQTGGVPPPLQEEQATTNAMPHAQGDDFYQRGTGGVAPQAHVD